MTPVDLSHLPPEMQPVRCMFSYEQINQAVVAIIVHRLVIKSVWVCFEPHDEFAVVIIRQKDEVMLKSIASAFIGPQACVIEFGGPPPQGKESRS